MPRMIGIAVPALMAVLGAVLGFRFGSDSEADFLLEKPERISWNGVSLATPSGTLLVSWPRLSGYYMLDVTKSVDSDSMNGAVSATTSASRLYAISDASFPIASWSDVSGEPFFHHHIESSILLSDGAPQAAVFCGQLADTGLSSPSYRLYVMARGHKDGLGFRGRAEDLPIFVEFAASAMQAIGMDGFVESGVDACIAKLSN